jgi:hypothetical protein
MWHSFRSKVRETRRISLGHGQTKREDW